MKKYQSILSLMLGLFVGLTIITACSSSDDESNSDNGEGEKPSTNKLLNKVIEETEYYTEITEYLYDNDGKVIQCKNYSYRGTDTVSRSSIITYNITYTKNFILVVGKNGTKSECTLENGLIVKSSYSDGRGEPSTYTYTYDNNNHMITLNSTRYQYKFIWSGGNLVRKERHDNYINDDEMTTYEYTSYLFPPNFHYMKDALGLDYITHAGEIPKNLPSKISRSGMDGGNIFYEERYEWVIENGLPVKAIVINFEKSRYSTSTITFEWK